MSYKYVETEVEKRPDGTIHGIVSMLTCGQYIRADVTGTIGKPKEGVYVSYVFRDGEVISYTTGCVDGKPIMSKKQLAKVEDRFNKKIGHCMFWLFHNFVLEKIRNEYLYG